MARRASLIKSIRDTVQNVLLFEVGDVFGKKGGDEQNKLYAELSLKAMDLMKYDAMNIGEAELIFGKNFLMEQIKSLSFPVISATILDNDTKKLITDKPYIIKKVKDLRVGVLGLCSNKYPIANPEKVNVVFNDPFEVAKKYVPELRKKCDLLIVLGHLDYDTSVKFAGQIPGVDLILSGHGWHITTDLVKINNTVIAQAGNQAKNLGRIDITINRKDASSLYSNFILPLDSRIKDDPIVSELVSQYKKKVDDLKK